MPHVKMAVSMFGAKAVARNPSIQREPAKTKAVRQLCLSITALAKGPSTEHIYTLNKVNMQKWSSFVYLCIMK